eukprot:Skav230945  [mRNA]  locus=scaffold3010:23488:24204:- [translate_table: standard]
MPASSVDCCCEQRQYMAGLPSSVSSWTDVTRKSCDFVCDRSAVEAPVGGCSSHFMLDRGEFYHCVPWLGIAATHRRRRDLQYPRGECIRATTTTTTQSTPAPDLLCCFTRKPDTTWGPPHLLLLCQRHTGSSPSYLFTVDEQACQACDVRFATNFDVDQRYLMLTTFFSVTAGYRGNQCGPVYSSASFPLRALPPGANSSLNAASKIASPNSTRVGLMASRVEMNATSGPAPMAAILP